MTTVQMMLSRLARPVCQSPEAAQVTEDVRGCCPSPGHSLTDSVTHECRDHCTMYTQPDITRTDSCPWGRAGTADLRHLTANDNIDSTQRTQSTWHQSLPCCIDFKSVSSQCQSEYCLSVSIVCRGPSTMQSLSLRSSGQHSTMYTQADITSIRRLCATCQAVRPTLLSISSINQNDNVDIDQSLSPKH